MWPDGIPDNPVKYHQEKVRAEKVNRDTPSQKNRVFSQVSDPTYMLVRPEKGKTNGISIVICPGGGFRDVWFDREGMDFALWLADKGITSLVLKYRTYNQDAEGFSLDREVYNREVYADAKQAIHTLRSQAGKLDLDPGKIGIGGYSAGGALALFAAMDIYEKQLPDYTAFSVSAKPDFACLVYPGIRESVIEVARNKADIPPIFMIVGGEDDVTPAEDCIRLYSVLNKKNVPAELHIYAKGTHGFDSGIGRGFGVAGWQDSFIAWLKDMKLMD